MENSILNLYYLFKNLVSKYKPMNIANQIAILLFKLYFIK